jgi:hypothetical protein
MTQDRISDVDRSDSPGETTDPPAGTTLDRAPAVSFTAGLARCGSGGRMSSVEFLAGSYGPAVEPGCTGD